MAGLLSVLILRRARYAPVSKDVAAPCFETRCFAALLSMRAGDAKTSGS